MHKFLLSYYMPYAMPANFTSLNANAYILIKALQNHMYLFRELQQKREQTEKMRNEMKTFQQARDSWRQKQKELVIIEERKIEEQNKMVADRSSAM